MKRLSIVLSLAFLPIVFGCSMGKVYYDYIVDVKNVGVQKFHDVEIESQQGFWFRTGYLVGGSVAGIGSPQPAPPNDIFTIILKREDGKKTEQVIDLRDKVEKGYRGRLLFIVNDDNELKYELQVR